MVVSLRPVVIPSKELNVGVSVTDNEPYMNNGSLFKYVYLDPGHSYYYDEDTQKIEPKKD